MAQIPGAQGLGQGVARPLNFNETQTPRGAFGAGVARTIEGIGADIAAQERREALEAEAARKAADRARALGAMQVAADDLAAMHDEMVDGVRGGSIDKTTAAKDWQTRSAERVNAALEGIPQDHRELAKIDLGSKAMRLGRGVHKAVTQRDQHDVRSGIDQTLEYASRLYLTQPQQADELVRGTLESLGPASGLAADQVTKLGQAWKEGSRYNRALSLVNGARRDNAALTKVEQLLAGDEFADMDPARRVQLSGQIEGFRVSNIQRAEADARRRQAEEERVLRRAESEFNAAQSLVASGKVLSPAYVEQVTKATAGTPFALAFQEAIKDAPAQSAFAMQPLQVQQQALMSARGQLNQAGTDPRTEKRVAALQRIYDDAVRDYKADPLPAALDRGILTELAPLDTSSMQGLAATVGQRVAQAQIVAQQVGQAVTPLTQREAEAVGEMLNVLPVKQRAAALAQMADVMGAPVAQAFARQIAGKDKALGLALALGSARTTEGRFTSELILGGAQAIKDKTIKADDTKVTGWRAEIAGQIGDAYINDEQRQAAIEAAFLVRAGLEAGGGGNNRQAVNLATGGIIDLNGRKVPLPYGVTEDQFEQRLRALTPASIGAATVFIAGKPMAAADFLAQVPDAQLIHAGQGRYAVSAGGAIATLDAEGRRPLKIEVR